MQRFSPLVGEKRCVTTLITAAEETTPKLRQAKRHATNRTTRSNIKFYRRAHSTVMGKLVNHDKGDVNLWALKGY